jgi:hypothetical protein
MAARSGETLRVMLPGGGLLPPPESPPPEQLPAITRPAMIGTISGTRRRSSVIDSIGSGASRSRARRHPVRRL